jgi:hypothetical protein
MMCPEAATIETIETRRVTDMERAAPKREPEAEGAGSETVWLVLCHDSNS